MRAVFVDATAAMARVARRVFAAEGVPLSVCERPDILPEEMGAAIGNAAVALIDHTQLATETARSCPALRHVIFLGTGVRSCMHPEQLNALGITVHTISGYGDTAVAEMTVALMWAAAKRITRMHCAMQAGQWQRTEGVQLSGKTLGLIGFGGIARELARLTAPYMTVLAWNRSPKACPGVEFVDLERLLGASDVVSMHLALNDETRGFLDAERLRRMKPEAMLVNTARGALVDEAAMLSQLTSGALAHAALDVFVQEPVPAAHPLLQLDNVTLSAHSAFRTPEAAENLIARAVVIAKTIRDTPST